MKNYYFLLTVALISMQPTFANAAITYTECVANFLDGTIAAVMNTQNAQNCNLTAQKCAQTYNVGFNGSQYYTFPDGSPQKIAVDWSNQNGKAQICN